MSYEGGEKDGGVNSPGPQREFIATGARPYWCAPFSVGPQTSRVSVTRSGLYFRVRAQIWSAESDPPEQAGIVEIGWRRFS